MTGRKKALNRSAINSLSSREVIEGNTVRNIHTSRTRNSTITLHTARNIWLLNVGLLLSAFFLATTLFVFPTSSHAATMGSGFHGNPIPGLQLPHLGNWITSDGIRAYCIEPGRNNPVASQKAAETVHSFPSYTTTSLGHSLSIKTLQGLPLAHINYIVNQYGDTANNAQAAAVQLAIWMLRDTPEAYLKEFYSVTAFSGTPSYQTSKNRAQSYILEAQQQIPSLAVTSPTVSLSLNEEKVSSQPPMTYREGTFMGNVVGWTGKTTLTGATVTPISTSGSLSVPLSGEASFEIVHDQNSPQTTTIFAYPQEHWRQNGNKYEVHAETELSAYPAAAVLHASTTSSQQRLMSAVPKQTRTLVHSLDSDGNMFEPEVSTHVTKQILEVGDFPADILRFYTASNSPEAPTWIFDDQGRPVPITVRATLYYSQRFITQSAVIPDFVEKIFETVQQIELDDGLQGQYLIESDQPVQSAGYYSWVTEILFDDQPLWVQEFLHEHYHYRSDIGIPEETHLLPMKLSIDTLLSTFEAGFGAKFFDEVTVNIEHGPWLEDAVGSPVPVTLTGSVYFIDDDPTLLDPADIPNPVTVLEETITGEGTIHSEPFFGPNSEGYVTIQWCIAEDTPYVNTGYCDEWAHPNETAKIHSAKFYTQAKQSAKLEESFTDTLSYTGFLPEGDLTVIFRAYLMESGEQVSKTTETQQCTLENELYISPELSIDRVPETQQLAYTEFNLSQQVRGEITQRHRQDSTYRAEIYWIAEVFTSQGDTIFRGECGDPDEVTAVHIDTPELANSGLAANAKSLTAASAGFTLFGVLCFMLRRTPRNYSTPSRQ